MSPAPEPIRPAHRPSPVAASGRRADVIEIGSRFTSRQPTTSGHDADAWEETVVLGRAVPYAGNGATTGATPRAIDRTTATPVTTESPVVDDGGLHRLLVDRREQHHPAPLPPRFQHVGRMLSSVVIVAGGVLAVRLAGTVGDVPVVARVALLATVLCGALLVAAQLTEEVRRARNRGRSPATAPTGHIR
ncbi:MAG: hypothetical protein OES24_22180 [Acidimicrobiia bacterium]|nr:hypothetical protein [Acidimicrobiia bacterium]